MTAGLVFATAVVTAVVALGAVLFRPSPAAPGIGGAAAAAEAAASNAERPSAAMPAAGTAGRARRPAVTAARSAGSGGPSRGTGVAGVAPAPAIERLLAPGRFAYYKTVRRLAREHSVEWRLVMAIIASESGGDPAAVSPNGAIGLMQLMPETAEHLGVDPWDPEQNLEGAVRYLASLLSSFQSRDLSLVAYNAGPGFAARYRRGEVELGAETRAFLIRVGRLLPPPKQ